MGMELGMRVGMGVGLGMRMELRIRVGMGIGLGMVWFYGLNIAWHLFAEKRQNTVSTLF